MVSLVLQLNIMKNHLAAIVYVEFYFIEFRKEYLILFFSQKDIFMHLTNYAIQKRSDDFIRDEDTGTKR